MSKNDTTTITRSPKLTVPEIIDYCKNELGITFTLMDEEKTTAEMDFRLSEIVREKIFIYTNDEVPHSISCKLVGYEEKNNIAYVYVDIIVDRDSLRKIIVGSGGNMIKNIGRESRIEMEKLLGMKVYLELYCKTIKKWREKDKYIKSITIKK